MNSVSHLKNRPGPEGSISHTEVTPGHGLASVPAPGLIACVLWRRLPRGGRGPHLTGGQAETRFFFKKDPGAGESIHSGLPPTQTYFPKGGAGEPGKGGTPSEISRIFLRLE